MPGAASAGGRSFQPFFRVIRNTKNLRSAERMIRYVAFASRDLEDREKGCFDRDRDHADVKAFTRRLPDHLTRHHAAPKAFHCLFSLPREQFEQCGLKDWKQVVRDVMSTYERETGRKLEWIAAHHNNEKHPHCHVIVKAVYERDDGLRRKLWLSKADLRQLRQITGRHLAYERAQHRVPEQVAGRLLDRPQVLRAADTFLQVLQQMIQEERRRLRQQERHHQRWLREEDDRER